MTTIAEQIASLEATRAAKAAAASAILEKCAKEGRSTDEAEAEEFDTINLEVKKVDEDLGRFRTMESLNKAAAVPVVAKTVKDASESRDGTIIRPHVQFLKKELPPGIRFARYVGALASCGGNRRDAAEFAKRWEDSTPELEAIFRVPSDVIERTAVAAGTTTDSTWAAPLVVYQNLQQEFINYLRPLTIIGRINGFRMVPFKVKVPRQTAGASVNWIGETKIKPVSSLAFDTVTMEFYKIAGIIALSEELIRFSNPSAEMLVRDDLAAAVVQLMDTDFVDPTKGLVAGISPASITNGLTAIVTTGTDADAFRADVKSMFDQMLAANLQLGSGVWIMTQSQALGLALMLNALGQPEFPSITVNGGTLLGFPVITSQNIPATTGSPADGYPIIFAMPGEIMLADDGNVSIDVSREASLLMDTSPDSPESASSIPINLWQHNMVGVKAERFINWLKRRANAVAYIEGAHYA